MQWLNNIMNWGGNAIQSQSAGQAGYGLGQPLVVGDVGSAQYAGGQGGGTNWGGLLFSAAQGYNQAQANQPKPTFAEHQGGGFGSPFENPGAAAFSGLLSSNMNRAQS